MTFCLSSHIFRIVVFIGNKGPSKCVASCFALITLLLSSTALFAYDYAPDTLWSRQIEIEGFSSLPIKIIVQTPDGGCLIGCDYFINWDDYDAVLIKLDSNYEVEWHSVFTSMAFSSQSKKIHVLENGNYDVLLCNQVRPNLGIFLHLSANGDSLDSIDLSSFGRVKDAVKRSDGGYIVLSGSSAIGLDSLGNEEWRRSYTSADLAWERIHAITSIRDGYYIIAGLTYIECGSGF